MTKLYRSPVKVELDARQRPRRFRWLGRWHRVFSCVAQEDERHWLSRLRELQPQRYRCETYQGMVCDLLFAEGEGTWVLERAVD
jgi:hypothetical protein